MLFKGKIISQTCCAYFSEIKASKEHNETQLNTLDTQLILTDAIDEIPKDIVLHKVRLMQLNKRR